MTEKTRKRADFLIDAAYVAVIALLVYISFKYVARWVLPFILAFGIATAARPLIERAARFSGAKKEAVSVVIMILIYVIVGAVLFLLAVQIVFAIRDALTLLPDYYSNAIAPALVKLNDRYLSFIDKFPERWRSQARGIKIDVAGSIQSFLIQFSQFGISFISKLTGSVPSFMIALVFTIMLSFFISVRYEKLILFFKTQLPRSAEKIAADIRVILVDTIFGYLRAVLTLMIITATGLAIGFTVLKVQNALPVAAGIAIFDALPFFGVGAIVIPWAIIELVGGNYAFAAGLIILYALVTVVREIIEPKIVGDKLGLNPVVSLCAIYLGFKVFGVLGMIVMPILARIAISLHNKGSIRLFRS